MSSLTKISPVIILGMSIYGCSILGPSYQQNISRKMAGVVNEGDFVINRCTPLAGEKKVNLECLQSEAAVGEIERAECGVPWPAYVLEEVENGTFAVLPLSGNSGGGQRVPLPANCLSPYVSDERVIQERLNLALAETYSKDDLVLIGEDQKTKYHLCGIGASAGLALVAEFPTSCSSQNVKVVSLKSMRVAVQNASDFSLGDLVTIAEENKICREARIDEIHQVFNEKMRSSFEAKVSCLGREIASERLSNWVELKNLALK